MNEGSFSTRRGRILILSLTVCAAALIAAVWWYYQRQRSAMETAAVSQLTAIANAKADQLANWRRERIGDGRVLAASPLIPVARRILASGAVTEPDRVSVLAMMKALANEFQYADVSLVELDGSVLIRLNEDRRESSQLRQRIRARLSRAALESHDVVLSDLSVDTRSGVPLMMLTVPVDDLGAFLLDIDPAAFLYPYLRSWPAPSSTAEALLARREGNDAVLLSEVRNAPGSPLVLRRSVADLNLPDEKELITGWLRRGPDYRGTETLGVIRRIPDSPWYLVAKIDRSEVEAPLRRLWWEMTFLVILITAANGAGVGFIWRNQQLQTYRDREEWLRAVANDTPAYLWMSRLGNESQFLNTPLKKFLGIDESAPARGGWTAYLHPEDAANAQAKFLECLAARREYTDEFRVRRYDGEYRWGVNQGVPRFSSTGEFVGYAGAWLDITERKQAEQRLLAANADLARELRERTRAEKEIHALSSRLIVAQEEERRRLARELHDDLSQQIAAASIGVSNLRSKIPLQPEALAQTERIQNKLAQVAEGIRRLSHELHPAVLEHSGLAAALRQYCSEFAGLTGVGVAVKTDGVLDGLTSNVNLCIYRIVQEALQNVVRHARVTAASVELRRSDGLLCLTVSDQGVGIEPDRILTPGGLGLISMKERCRLVNGSVEIQSEPNRGTTLTVRIPLAQAASNSAS